MELLPNTIVRMAAGNLHRRRPSEVDPQPGTQIQLSDRPILAGSGEEHPRKKRLAQNSSSMPGTLLNLFHPKGTAHVLVWRPHRRHQIERGANVVATADAKHDGTEGELLKLLTNEFATVRHLIPISSRDDSAELFVLAMAFRA